MKTINLTVENEYVSGAGLVAGAKGSKDSTILRVTFVGWDNLSKYATFKDAHGENETVVVLALDMLVEENVYDVPIVGSAFAEEGLMSVTFTGYEVENGNELSVVTNTARANLRVLPSDAILADDYSMDATLAQQLQSEMDLLKDAYDHLPEKVEEAATYASASQTSANNSLAYSVTSKSYAMGDTGSREGEETDNAKYYKEQAQEFTYGQTDSAQAYRNECRTIYENITGGFLPAGSIYFANLPDLEQIPVGYLYSIKDAFTTTEEFKEGAGVEHEAGTSVYKTVDGYWDCNVTDIATLQSELDDLESTVTSQGSSITSLNSSVTSLNTSVGSLQSSVSSLSSGKVDKVSGKGLSTNDFTAAYKTKLDGIATGANKTTVDSSLSSSSTNPVQNKVVYNALTNKSNVLATKTTYLGLCGSEWVSGAQWVEDSVSGSIAWSGYTPLGIVGVELFEDAGRTAVAGYKLNGNTATVYVMNYNDIAKVNVTVLYVKN